MFVEGVGDLQPLMKAVTATSSLQLYTRQGHLTLEIINIVLHALPGFHLDCEKVVVFPLEFSPRSKLIVKCIGYFMKILERIPRERIKPVVGDPLEAGRECSTEKEVIVSITAILS